MPLPRLIPTLDVAGGRVVKGVGFQRLRDMGSPAELGARYARDGADELVLLDIAATPEGTATMLGVVERVADVVDIPFTVGGGVRSVRDAARIIEAGADRISINSAALATPSLITELASRFGSQAVVVAIDAIDGFARASGGQEPTGVKVLEWAVEAATLGAGEILLTSIPHDGRRSGYDLELTATVRDAVGVPVIASGGAGCAAHVAAALDVADAAIVASIVHEHPDGLTRLRGELFALGVALRPLVGLG
jgi:imidazole glycerol-phosphate synthase subunit HisF